MSPNKSSISSLSNNQKGSSTPTSNKKYNNSNNKNSTASQGYTHYGYNEGNRETYNYSRSGRSTARGFYSDYDSIQA